MEIAHRARRVKLLLLDVDGVLTDGRLYYDASGEVLKTFFVHDGFGIKQWHKAGFRSGIISGRSSPIVKFRAEELGIKFVKQDRDDKLTAFHEIVAEANVLPEECAFIGDDSLDVQVFEHVGLAAAVAAAHPDAKRCAHYVTEADGG